MSKELNRPAMIKPDRSSAGSTGRLTNISTKKKNTTGESPKTVRMTPAEKMLAQ